MNNAANNLSSGKIHVNIVDESGAVYFDDVQSATSPRVNTVSTFLQHRYGTNSGMDISKMSSIGTDGFKTQMQTLEEKDGSPETTYPLPSSS